MSLKSTLLLTCLWLASLALGAPLILATAGLIAAMLAALLLERRAQNREREHHFWAGLSHRLAARRETKEPVGR